MYYVSDAWSKHEKYRWIMAYVFWMHSLLCCTHFSTCLTVFTTTVMFSLSSQDLRNLQAVTEWMCQILMWCLHLLSCFASCPSKILYPSTNSHNTIFQKKVIPIASNTRVDGIKDKLLFWTRTKLRAEVVQNCHSLHVEKKKYSVSSHFYQGLLFKKSWNKITRKDKKLYI